MYVGMMVPVLVCGQEVVDRSANSPMVQPRRASSRCWRSGQQKLATKKSAQARPGPWL